MARLGWSLHFATACGAGAEPPSEASLAKILRDEAAGVEPIDPKLLLALADMLDCPAGRDGATLKIRRERGGRYPQYDEIKIGMLAATRIHREGVKRFAVFSELAGELGCDEITVRRALKKYETLMAQRTGDDIETSD